MGTVCNTDRSGNRLHGNTDHSFSQPLSKHLRGEQTQPEGQHSCHRSSSHTATPFLRAWKSEASLGGLFGFGSSYVICQFSGWTFLLSVSATVLGVGIASGVGISFGFYPTDHAAQLDPIAALRTH